MPEQVKPVFVFIVAMMALPLLGFAQSGSMEETMYSSGKINVVFAVVVVMLLVIVVYLILLDKRLRKIEQQENTEK